MKPAFGAIFTSSFESADAVALASSAKVIKWLRGKYRIHEELYRSQQRYGLSVRVPLRQMWQWLQIDVPGERARRRIEDRERPRQLVRRPDVGGRPSRRLHEG